MPYTYADYYNGRSSQPGSQLSNERQLMAQLMAMQGGGSVYTNGLMQRPGDSMLKQAGMTREQFLRMQALQRGRQMGMGMGITGGGASQRPAGMMHGGLKPPGPMGGMLDGVHPYAQQQQVYGVPQQATSMNPYGSYTGPQQANPMYLRSIAQRPMPRSRPRPRRPQPPLPFTSM